MEVYCIGIERWPAGIKVDVFSLEKDKITAVSRRVSGFATWLKSKLGRDYQTVPINYLPGAEHGLEHIYSRKPELFLALYGRPDGTLD